MSALKCPHKKKSILDKSDERARKATSPPRPIHRRQNVALSFTLISKSKKSLHLAAKFTPSNIRIFTVPQRRRSPVLKIRPQLYRLRFLALPPLSLERGKASSAYASRRIVCGIMSRFHLILEANDFYGRRSEVPWRRYERALNQTLHKNPNAGAITGAISDGSAGKVVATGLVEKLLCSEALNWTVT
ncbi:hypothetical protein AVEN_213005-1 [Araneus ventricosus]|uniref:Uncharacterized protein n=1 Tax=Araneus ventricosus TaxID=182803 RepID=A0A4Y2JTR7_ARAVE|nr:hypothetical protein AVEN_213005-1 [Araneus ventricosus]